MKNRRRRRVWFDNYMYHWQLHVSGQLLVRQVSIVLMQHMWKLTQQLKSCKPRPGWAQFHTRLPLSFNFSRTIILKYVHTRVRRGELEPGNDTTSNLWKAEPPRCLWPWELGMVCRLTGQTAATKSSKARHTGTCDTPTYLSSILSFIWQSARRE